MKTDPEAHAELESERDFLLRSLDDLDDELTAGNIDADTYRVLHDDYTARAAAVIKSLDDGVARPEPEAPRARPALRVVTAAGIVMFAVVAAFLLAHSVGQRSPGQTVTGNSQFRRSTPTTESPGQLVADAKQAAEAQPKSYDAHVRYARALLDTGDTVGAVQQYVAASNLDPTQAEPLAYSGWIGARVATGVTDPATRKTLLDEATARLDRAITVDPTYAPAYVFKGLLLAQIENRPCAAVPDYQQYLVRTPQDDPMRPQVLDALRQAVEAGKCPTQSTTKTP
ncbi:MAG TPA: hypothetical protein VN636_19605 [Acidimicrobiia bacterium]|nr:hypothetical protein [Acidimicrobiia bacterium]